MGNYSRQVYGDENRVLLDALQIFYLQLLPDESLENISKAGGVCRYHAKYKTIFYAPHHVRNDPLDTMWLRKSLYESHAVPIANHSWVEVSHCGSSRDELAPFSRNATPYSAFHFHYGPLWLFVAHGSGVSLNVGRTLVFNQYADAIPLIQHLFNHTRVRCPPESKGLPEWLQREPSHEPSERGAAEWRAVGPDPPASFAPGLDSLQVLGHHEHFSSERRHELIFLRAGECATLAAWQAAARDSHAKWVRCGRALHASGTHGLTPCSKQSVPYRMMNRCRSPHLGWSSKRVSQLLSREHVCAPPVRTNRSNSAVAKV